MGMCNLCYAFRNSPQPRCSVLELAFSKAEIRSFLKANVRLSATWNMSLLDVLLVYRVASHSSICKNYNKNFYLYCAEGLHVSASI